VLFYNIDALQKAGVPLPDKTWSWNEMIKWGKQVTRDTNGDGRIDQFMYLPLWNYLYFYQYGNSIFDPVSGRCLLDQPNAVAAMEFQRDLVFKYHIAPRPLETATLIASGGSGDAGLGAYDLFPLGRVVCMPCNMAVVPYYQKACKFRWDITKIPRGPTDVQLVDGAAYPILAQTRYPREAWELVKFLSGPWVQSLRAKAGDSVPSLKKIAESPLFLDQPAPPAHRRFVLDMFDRYKTFPQHERLGAVEQITGRWFERIMSDENPIQVQDGLRQCAAEVNALIESED
jgi:multiple sugar transport system substrate-binding protein